MFKAFAELVTRPLIRNLPFRSTAEYWETRYRLGGISGRGSRIAGQERAAVINSFVAQHGVRSVIDFGSGDGEQAAFIDCPQYLGFDISRAAVRRCEKRFRNDPVRRFRHVSEYEGETADLVLSVQVIFHLVEDDVYEAYMRRLFGAARRFVIIYSTNDDKPARQPHVRPRRFTEWVAANVPAFRLARMIPWQGDRYASSDFYIYERTQIE